MLGACPRVGLQPVVNLLVVGELDSAGFLDRQGEDLGLAFVAEVGQGVAVLLDSPFPDGVQEVFMSP